jgi:hypothetical protein
MKIMFYLDWPLAMTYLKPLYDFIKQREPTWDLFFHTNCTKTISLILDLPHKDEQADIAIVCDELSACSQEFKICIFHGLYSKGQAFCSTRKNDFIAFNGMFAVPSEYYKDKLLNLKVDSSKIFVSGLTKHDGLKRNILYAPTHNHTLSAIPVIKERIYEIPNVKVHLHMYTRTGTNNIHKKLREYYPVHEDREDIYDLLNECDVIIGDFGSIILEGIALGKQAIQVVNPKWKDWYTKIKKIPKKEIYTLPEVELPDIFGIKVHSFDELKKFINGISIVGGACETIYNKIKDLKQC